MKPPQRIVWTEGMLMSPHHLQQQDLYHERLLFSRLETLSPYHWGVVAMDLDPAALGRGELHLAAFCGVLSDGMPVRFDAGDGEGPPARPIGEHHPGGAPLPLEVFLAVPREREGAPSFLEGQGNGVPARARFATISRKVPDLVDVVNQAEVSFGKSNLAILFGDEPRDDFATVKIAEIVRDGTGSLVPVPTYVPPCLRISASRFVMDGLRRVLGLILGKQRELSERRRHRDESTVEFDAPDVTMFLQLAALNGLIPMLKHIADSGDIPPYALYLLLSQGAGQLATFSTEVEPVDLPSFVFTDLRATFEPLFATLTLLVRDSVKDPVIKVPLQIKNGVHFGILEGDEYTRCHQYLLAVKAEKVSLEEVTRDVPGKSKVASWNDLRTIIQGAKPGVPLRVTHRPPAQIAVRPGVAYFVLDTASSYWQQISAEKRVGIFLPHPFDPAGGAQVELLGIPDAS